MYKIAVSLAAVLAVAVAEPSVGVAPLAYSYPAPVATGYHGSYLPANYGYGYNYGVPSTYAYSPVSYASVPAVKQVYSSYSAPVAYAAPSYSYSSYPGHSLYPNYYSGLSGYKAYSPLNYNSYLNPSSLYWKKK